LGELSGLAVLALVVACGHHGRPAAAVQGNVASGDDITLFRDGALVRQRVAIEVGSTGMATVKVAVASGVGAEQVVVVDREGLEVRALHATSARPVVPVVEEDAGSDADAGSDDSNEEGSGSGSGTGTGSGSGTGSGAMTTSAPSELRVEVAARHPGSYALTLAYMTDRVRWDAAYTMTANEGHDRVVLRGALAIRNASGVTFHGTVHVIDAELGAWRGKLAEKLATDLAGSTPGGAPAPTLRDLGRIDMVQGETRVELLAGTPPHAMRSVLVYDPIGTKLDNPGSQPVRDASLGLVPSPPQITESFEVERDERATSGLPAGPVRLLEHRADGSLGVLGESRLYDAATRVANVDTIAVGTAEGVTGQRERRELTVDEANRRVVEEVAITIDNQRPAPVTVLLREHMYRGQNWSLAYFSAASAAKEGPQQIALRTEVPAKTQQKVLYVVVYTW
jgi:hypothetical protein